MHLHHPFPLLAAASTLGLRCLSAPPVRAATFTNLQFLSGDTVGTEVLNLASPGQILSGNSPFLYNTIDDNTGTKLVTSNGDLADFTLSGLSTSGALGAALGAARVVIGATGSSSPLSPVSSGRVGAQQSFTGTVSSNNPGTVISNSFQLLFNSNLAVTDASFNFSSLNTAGSSWEYSVIQLLNAAGNPFSTLTNPGFTVGAASQHATASSLLFPGGGFTGQAGVGNFIAAQTKTVSGVGTISTSSGMSGDNDNISGFDYNLAGLSPGTQIGGIRWTTYFEDVRGTGNNASNFSSSLLDFTISGTVTPVTAPLPLLGATAAFSMARRIRKRVRLAAGSCGPRPSRASRH